MHRPYQESSQEEVHFFVGYEIEKTPAKGLPTLFVVGTKSIDDINSRLSDSIEHIYFGANQSFPIIQTNDFSNWSLWEKMIVEYLELGYICTLDIPSECIEGLLESGLCEYINFIPMISVKLPYIQQLGYNATIKLDDKGFASTNPGVWCHQVHDLMNRNNYTNWNDYKQDSILK